MGKHNYGLVFDAGSSGTRVYVYKWLKPDVAHQKADDPEDLQHLPEVETKKKWIKKIHPGISTFGEKPEAVGPDHLKELVDFATDIVPKDEIETTPVFLLATAGMRLLPDHQRGILLENICSYFQKHSGFHIPDCDLHIQVIPGETEGLYGWVAANYLLGGFDTPNAHQHGGGHHTYGFLDMGGASAQIAFAPNSTESVKHADDLKLLRLRRVDGHSQEYQIFVTTWLGFGANEARKRFLQRLIDAYGEVQAIPDPCLPTGISIDASGAVIPPQSRIPATQKPTFDGIGDFTQCLKSTYPLLEKEIPCPNPPCLLNGVHTPAIDFAVNHFVGVSEFWHTTHEIFAMAHKDKAYDFATYQKQVTDFCSRKWDDIKADVKQEKWGDKVDEKTVEEVCFKASWLISVLHDGIGVPRIGIEQGAIAGNNKTVAVIDGAKDRGFLDPFQAVDKIEGKEVSWTLGKIVLYASSQMPPASDDTLAVGFGSNQPGSLALPSDFQYAGGQYEALPVDQIHDSDDDWHNKVFSGSYSHRVPGIFIFLVILALAVYLLCGRERRLSLYHRLLSALGRRPSTPKSGSNGLRRRKTAGFTIGGGGGGKRSSPGHNRSDDQSSGALLEDVELGDLSDSSSSDNTINNTSSYLHNNNSLDDLRSSGLASGIATPAIGLNSPDLSRTPSRSVMATMASKGYFDTPLSQVVTSSSAHGLATPFERVHSNSGFATQTAACTASVASSTFGRTESRESLIATRSEVARSRRTSPVRRSSLAPFKESKSKE